MSTCRQSTNSLPAFSENEKETNKNKFEDCGGKKVWREIHTLKTGGTTMYFSNCDIKLFFKSINLILHLSSVF